MKIWPALKMHSYTCQILYIHRCLKKEEFPSLAAFKHEVKEFMHLERTIAFKNNRANRFLQIWENLLNI